MICYNLNLLSGMHSYVLECVQIVSHSVIYKQS